MLHSLLGQTMNSSAGGTEGKLASIVELYVEDTVEPSGQLELLWDQAAAKIAAALVTGWELLAASLRFPQSMGGGVVAGEGCLVAGL